MFKSVKQLLDGVPSTESKVVTLRPSNEDDPPPALKPTWREIKASRRTIADLEASREDAQRRIDDALEQAKQVVSRIGSEIEQERAQLLAAQERWIMMTRDLGIDIQEDASE